MPPSTPTVYSIASKDDVSEVCRKYDVATDQLIALSSKASAAKSVAYCPYSRFRVGATILTHSGEYISGANVENAAYPVGTCAERVAFGKAVTDMAGGYRKGVFKALAVATDISPPASPCGMCRQFIREFCDLETPIFMFDKDNNFAVMRLEELLPVSFGPEALPPPQDLPKADRQ